MTKCDYPKGMRRVVSGCVSVLLAGLIFGVAVGSARGDASHAKPKLVVVLVLDQFRGDYLDRFRDDFKTANGFNLFLKRGAYFTDCYYDYANTMTAPGHSTIGTGAYTNGHGISLNDWWDFKRSTVHPVSSVEEERYAVVGEPGSSEVGASPRNELASTLGDEVVLGTGGRAKLFGVSLKDRAAILTSGHASKGAVLLDQKTGKFVSSTYWETELPEWARAFNASGRAARAETEAGAKPGRFYEDVGRSPASVSYLLDFAEALVAGEQMGRHDVTDVLTISISSTDILGHEVGPDSMEMRSMMTSVDVNLNQFFSWLDEHVDGGLGNVWVAMTGDHGVAPVPERASAVGMPAAVFDGRKVLAEVNERLNQRYSAGREVKYVLGGEMPYVELDSRAFAAVKVGEAEAEGVVAEMLPEALEATLPKEPEGVSQVRLAGRPSIRHVYTKVQMAAGQVPNTEEGR